jgi:hypothetical protein
MVRRLAVIHFKLSSVMYSNPRGWLEAWQRKKPAAWTTSERYALQRLLYNQKPLILLPGRFHQ